jgi:hypothetical protein
MGSYISKGMSGAMEKMQEQQQTMVKTEKFSIKISAYGVSARI